MFNVEFYVEIIFLTQTTRAMYDVTSILLHVLLHVNTFLTRKLSFCEFSEVVAGPGSEVGTVYCLCC